LDQISHFVMKPEMAPAALALSAAGVDFSALKYRLSAGREGWIGFLEAFPPRDTGEWFAFLLEDDLPVPVFAWLESRAPLADEELVHAACRGARWWERRNAFVQVIVRRFKNGELTDGAWCPFLEGVAMKGMLLDELEIRAWLAVGCNVNCRDDDGTTLLMRVAGRRQEQILQALLRAGADVNLRTSGGKTALMYAAESSWCSCVTVGMLIAARANVHFRMDNGDSALSIALRKANVRSVWLLLNAGADPLSAFPDFEAAAAWKERYAGYG
jgi:hypothetical protein